MATIAEVFVKVGADLKNFNKGMDRVKQETQKISSAFSRASDTFTNAGRSLTKLGTAATAASAAALGVGLNYLSSMQQAEVGLNTLTGSAEKTAEIMKELQDFAVSTPFDFPEMLTGTRRLIGMGVAADDATAMIKATADAVSAAGGGAEELDGVITALGQIQAKGKVSAEEMNQLAERGIPAWGILSEVMGKPTNELMEMAAQGKLLASDALPALRKGFEDTFGGAAAEQANTFGGRVQNLKEQFQILAATLAEPLFEPLSNAMGLALEKIEQFSTWFQSLSPEVQKFITISAILVPVLTTLAGVFLLFIGYLPKIAAFLNSITTGFSLLGQALSFLTGPIGLTIAAITLIGTTLVLAYQKVDWFREMVNYAWETIKTAFNSALKFISEIVHAIISNVSSFIGEQLSKIQAFWDEHGEQIMSIVRGFMDFIGSLIESGMKFIQGVFEVVWPAIQGVVKVAWNLIKTIISTSVDIVLGLVEAGLALLRGDWEGAWDAIKGVAEDIWGNIEQFFKNVDLFQIGKDIIQGLIDGIGAMGSAAWDAAKNIARSVKDSITSFLGISSPAKELIKIGQWTGEGFKIGIEHTLEDVAGTAKSLAQAAMPDAPITREVTSPSMAIGISADERQYYETMIRKLDEVGRRPTILKINDREFARATWKEITKQQERELSRRGRFWS